MIKIRYRALAGIVAIVLVLANPQCAQKGNGTTDNGTGLPDGKVHSVTKIGDGSIVEICVDPENGQGRKCKKFTKNEVSGCKIGSYWPDCYHLPVKRAEEK